MNMGTQDLTPNGVPKSTRETDATGAGSRPAIRLAT